MRGIAHIPEALDAVTCVAADGLAVGRDKADPPRQQIAGFRILGLLERLRRDARWVLRASRTSRTALGSPTPHPVSLVVAERWLSLIHI